MLAGAGWINVKPLEEAHGIHQTYMNFRKNTSRKRRGDGMNAIDSLKDELHRRGLLSAPDADLDNTADPRRILVHPCLAIKYAISLGPSAFIGMLETVISAAVAAAVVTAGREAMSEVQPTEPSASGGFCDPVAHDSSASEELGAQFSNSWHAEVDRFGPCEAGGTSLLGGACDSHTVSLSVGLNESYPVLAGDTFTEDDGKRAGKTMAMWGKGKAKGWGKGKRRLENLKVLDCSVQWPIPTIATYASTEIAVLMCDDEDMGSVGFEEVSLDMDSSYTSRVTCGFLVDQQLQCCLENVHKCVWDATYMIPRLRCTDLWTLRTYLIHAMHKTAINISDLTQYVSEGGSAGLAYVVACFALAIGKTLPRDVALTGIVDSKGKCGSVGGVEAKVKAAAASGISTIYVPQANSADVIKLDRTLDVKIRLVATV